jgi:hypothetical protein
MKANEKASATSCVISWYTAILLLNMMISEFCSFTENLT